MAQGWAHHHGPPAIPEDLPSTKHTGQSSQRSLLEDPPPPGLCSERTVPYLLQRSTNKLCISFKKLNWASHAQKHNKKIPTVADTDYQDDGSALRQHFKYSLLACDMKRVFLLHDIMQWDLGRSAEGPCTQKCNEPIVQKTLYCTLTYH